MDHTRRSKNAKLFGGRSKGKKSSTSVNKSKSSALVNGNERHEVTELPWQCLQMGIQRNVREGVAQEEEEEEEAEVE